MEKEATFLVDGERVHVPCFSYYNHVRVAGGDVHCYESLAYIISAELLEKIVRAGAVRVRIGLNQFTLAKEHKHQFARMKLYIDEGR